MLTFPATPLPSRPLNIQAEDKTYITSLQLGQEQRRQIWAFPRRYIQLKYAVITASEMDTLWNFFTQTNGRKDAFWFFWLFVDTYTGEYVGRGDDSTQLFDLPAKSTVEGNLVVYVGGAEPSVGDWVENGTFETGDYTGWTQNSSAIDSGTVRTGTYSSKLEASGSDVDGAECDVIIVNPEKKYDIDSWHNVSSYTAGTYKFVVQFYSDEDGSTLISESVIFSETATTGGWDQGLKSVGPASASPDITFPANTASIKIQQKWDGTPTGIAYMDDVSININGATVGYVMLEGGGGGSADRVYFQPGNNVPTEGSLITTDIEGILRFKMRFKNSKGVPRSMFSYQLHSTGIDLIEVKESS